MIVTGIMRLMTVMMMIVTGICVGMFALTYSLDHPRGLLQKVHVQDAFYSLSVLHSQYLLHSLMRYCRCLIKSSAEH